MQNCKTILSASSSCLSLIDSVDFFLSIFSIFTMYLDIHHFFTLLHRLHAIFCTYHIFFQLVHLVFHHSAHTVYTVSQVDPQTSFIFPKSDKCISIMLFYCKLFYCIPLLKMSFPLHSLQCLICRKKCRRYSRSRRRDRQTHEGRGIKRRYSPLQPTIPAERPKHSQRQRASFCVS